MFYVSTRPLCDRLRLFIFACTTALFSCDSTGITETNTTLFVDSSNLINYEEVVAEIFANGQSKGVFTFNGAQQKTVYLSGINNELSNTITVNWHKTSNGGKKLKLATQTKTFLGGESILIDSFYESSLYDQDGDGISNLIELQSATCPWITCDHENEVIDISKITSFEYLAEDSSQTGNITLKPGNQWDENRFEIACGCSTRDDIAITTDTNDTTLFFTLVGAEFTIEANFQDGYVRFRDTNGNLEFPIYEITKVITAR